MGEKKTIKKTEEKAISVNQISSTQTSVSGYVRNYKTVNFLEALKNEYDEIDAIELIVTKTPDGAMALATYLNYTMQGGEFEFYNARSGRVTKKYDREFRDFCSRVGKANSGGLDGINREMAMSSYLRGGMAIEIVVKEDLSDIEEIVVIDPKTFKKYDYNEKTKEWGIYQQSKNGNLVNLYDGNFYWIPYQPKIGTPIGTLKFAPTIMATTAHWQFLSDTSEVLKRIAFPRYVLSIALGALMANATPQQKTDPIESKKLVESAIELAEKSLRGIGATSDIITTDTNKVDTIGGGVNGSGIDVRAWSEVFDPIMCNAFQLPLVLLNRDTGGSYALSTAEMKSFVDTVDSQRLSLKRMNEVIANSWARVHGYPIKARYTPNPLDWQKKEEKWKAKLLELEHARRSEEYGYIDKALASHRAGGLTIPSFDSKDMYEYLKPYIATELEKTKTKLESESTSENS